uniref:Putative phagocytosis n=1 Tax=Corethrella appendiculata TaxID=1370023 RepID=U5EHE2_9DIPT
MKFKQILNNGLFVQTFTVIVVNLLALSFGLIIGWTSPSMSTLLSDETPIVSGPLTIDQISWIGSLTHVGVMIGDIMAGVLLLKVGKKLIILLFIMPHVVFCLSIYFATEVYQLYIAKICGGITGGGSLTVIPLFTSDIADKKIRGALSSMLLGFLHLGVLVGFIIGELFNYHTVPLVMLSTPILFVLLIGTFPESPHSLIEKNKIEEARASLLFFRGRDADKDSIECELKKLQISLKMKSNNTSDKLKLSYFATPEARKGILIGIFLVIFKPITGSTSLATYPSIIFKSTGSYFSPNTSSIILGTLLLLGTIITFIFVDRIGRKMLLSISAIMMGSSLLTLGVFSFFKNDLNVSWISDLSLSMAVLSASIGIIPLPFVMIIETLPQNIRTVGSMCCTFLLTIIAFVVLKCFPILLEAVGVGPLMISLGVICFIGMIIIKLIIPETKCKDLLEVDEMDSLK